MNRVRLWTVLLGGLLLLCQAGFAQSDNANVNGVITDPSGSAVPNAKITLKNQATGLTREATTNESGVYAIPTVPPGMYTLSVEATGFKKFETKDNKVDQRTDEIEQKQSLTVRIDPRRIGQENLAVRRRVPCFERRMLRRHDLPV